jgi:multiple sugar transport system substrate-binding protein
MRRFLLVFGAFLCCAGLIFASGAKEGSKGSPYAGTTITFLTQAAVNMDNYPKLFVDRFEKETGIKVNFVTMPFLQIHSKLITDFLAKSGQYDLVATVGYWVPEFYPAGYYTPMDKFLNDPKLRDPNFDFKDFLPAFVDYSSKWNGVLYGIPFFTDSEIFYYRKDLLEKAGFTEPPKTWSDFDSYAAKIAGMQVDGKTVYGTTMDLGDQDTADAFILRYTSMGQNHDLLTPDRKTASFDNDTGVKAVQAMKDELKYCPPGVTSYDYTAAANSFLNGDVAMHFDWSYLYGVAQDPTKSKIAGKVGVAPLPADPGCKPGAPLGGWALAVGAYSKHQEAAFLFAQFIKSKAAELEGVQKLGFPPTRVSVFSDPEAQKVMPYLDVLKTSVANGVALPRVPQFTNLMELQAAELQRAISQQITPQQAVDNIGSAWKDVLSK